MISRKRTVGVSLLTLSLLATSQVTFADETRLNGQKITIHKVVTKADEQLSQALDASKLVGVNGASFKIYDITDLMKSELETLKKEATDKAKTENEETKKADKTAEQAISSERDADLSEKETIVTDKLLVDEALSLADVETISSEDFSTRLLETAQKQDIKQLKVYAQGATKTIDGVAGQLEVSLPFTESLDYHAYYIVNDEVDDNTATLSEPMVVITPQCDETGLPLKRFTVFPKSQLIEKEQPKTGGKLPDTNAKKLPNTGIKADFWAKIVAFCLK
jgi:hypothetical protein